MHLKHATKNLLILQDCIGGLESTCFEIDDITKQKDRSLLELLTEDNLRRWNIDTNWDYAKCYLAKYLLKIEVFSWNTINTRST